MIDALVQYVLAGQNGTTAALPLRGFAHVPTPAESCPPADGTVRMRDIRDIEQSRQGHSDAYRRLIERHQPHISRLLWRFTRDKNRHEELVQETFVQAYLSLPSYKAQAPFEHWLTRIATRVGYRFWKEARRHRHTELLDNDSDRADSRDPLEHSDAAELVHSLLAQLPLRDRLVLTLRYLEECDLEETARRTGWSVALVKVQTHRAKQKLKKLVESAGLELDT